MVTWLTDLKVAARMLLKARGFTATACFSLGLGMALCLSVLAVANAYLFKGLPYPSAERLYSLRFGQPGIQPPSNLETLDWSSLDDLVEHQIAWDLDVFYLTGGDHTEPAPGAWVTRGFMEGLGVRPALGRTLDDEAFLPNSPQVALISDALWQRRFGRDPDVLGRTFRAYVSDRPEEAETFTIVGVLPAGFWHFNAYTELLVPLRSPAYPYMIRLRAGVSAADAADRITALVRSSQPDLAPEWRAGVVSTHDLYVGSVRPVLRALTAAAGLVLLVAWANVTGLLLIRATRRQKELAVRAALGASRAAIARLLALEAALLAGAGTAIGLAVTALTLGALAPFIGEQLGREAPGGEAAFAVDRTVLLGAAALGLIVAAASALAPLAALWRARLAGMLQGTGRGATEAPGSRRARSTLIALEVAASFALLAGSLLMIQSVVRMLHVDLGIVTARVETGHLALRHLTYPDAPAREAFYARFLDRARDIPDVASVAIGDWWPLQAPRVQQVGTDESHGGPTRVANAGVLAVSPGYFEALRIPVLAGRTFDLTDDGNGEAVALVSASLAERLWPGRHPVGQRVELAARATVGLGVPASVRLVIGVVRDVRHAPDDEQLEDLYVPILQAPPRFAWVYARGAAATVAALPSLRDVARELDAENVALSPARSLEAEAAQLTARPMFLASLLAVLAVLASLLALVGVYGVIAYGVRQREREIAVRIALGAEPQKVAAMFLRQGGVVVGAGLVLGAAGAVLAGRALESQLFGVRPVEPLTLAVAATGFLLAGGLAAWWPARSAAATDPAIALRTE